MRSITSSLAVFIAVLLGACGAPGGAPASDAEQSVPRGAARSIPPPSKADPIVEPHQIPNGGRPVFGTATYRPTPDGITVLSGTLIDDDGVPVVGARVWTGPEYSIRELQASDHAIGPVFETSSATTGVDGRFEVRSPRARIGLASLVARKDGHSELALPIIELVPGHELDLGIRVLRRGVPFEVEFVDADGLPVEGVGLARVWTEDDRGSYAYPQWHGVSGRDGIAKTRSVPRIDVMARNWAWLSALIPGQVSMTLPIDQWSSSPGARHRYVLPPRRWVVGRLIDAPPGRRFGVSTSGFWGARFLPWSVHQYGDGHPLLRNRTPVTPTTGTFRVPTWSGGGAPYSSPKLVVHVERSDGTWQPILQLGIEEEDESATTGHDASFPPLEVQVPRLVRFELPPGRVPKVTMTVHVSLDAESQVLGRVALPSTGGEFYVALSEACAGATQLHMTVSGASFDDYEATVVIADSDPVIDLGRIDLRPRPPVLVRFVDDATGAPVEGVVWNLWDSSDVDWSLLHLDGGRSDRDGRTLMHVGHGWTLCDIVPPVGYEATYDVWGTHEAETDATGAVVIRLVRLDQQPIRVVDSKGRPRAGLIVRADDEGTPTVTDADGRAVVHGWLAEDGVWEIFARSAARAGDWCRFEGEGNETGYSYDGVIVNAGALATVVAPRYAPYWVQAWSDGVAVKNLHFPYPDDNGISILANRDRPGLLRIDIAGPGEQVLELVDPATGVTREVRFDHPGPDRTAHVDLSPASVTGQVLDVDGLPLSGVTVRAAPQADAVDQLDAADEDGLISKVLTSDRGTFRLPIVDLDKPLELTFDMHGFVMETRRVGALGSGEERDLGLAATMFRPGALSISLAPAATESRRVQIWPADAKVAGDDWAGVRTVHPGKPVVLTGLREGDYELEVLGMRHVLRTVAVTIIAGEAVELVLEKD